MDSGDYNPGQWEWKPPTTTTTETTFIETSPIQEPLSGDFKVRNDYRGYRANFNLHSTFFTGFNQEGK